MRAGRMVVALMCGVFFGILAAFGHIWLYPMTLVRIRVRMGVITDSVLGFIIQVKQTFCGNMLWVSGFCLRGCCGGCVRVFRCFRFTRPVTPSQVVCGPSVGSGFRFYQLGDQTSYLAVRGIRLYHRVLPLFLGLILGQLLWVVHGCWSDLFGECRFIPFIVRFSFFRGNRS